VFTLGAVKAFARWLVLDRRAPDNPLAHLKSGDGGREKRRARRPLSVD
jgi:hypothetical protein